jgi:exopolysaccharide biosynthesis protein
MHIRRLTFNLVAILITHLDGVCQTIDLTKYQTSHNPEGISVYHIDSNSIFTNKQSVIVVGINSKALAKHSLEIAYSDSTLKKTSRFAEDSQALVALNGSFFDVSKGGSVVYLESDGKVIARNRPSKEKWAKTDSLLNGAIIIDVSGNMKIEKAKNTAFYEQSKNEKAVLISGPILLVGGWKVPLENSDFIKKKHPRSCLCKTADKSIFFIAIDGRSDVATGMNLKEVQNFLLRLNCKDAINLDGGGSTTLWINDDRHKKILNKPSDKEGERPVANIILLKE